MDYIKLLENAGALLKGHFLLTSGLHSARYIEKMRLLEDPELLEPFLLEMKKKCPDAEWVIGPTLGGAILAFELARLLGIKSAYAERAENGRILKREYKIMNEDRIVIVDDILTTGGSIKDTIESINRGKILLSLVMIDRSTDEINTGIPLESIVKYPIENFEPTNCPLCRENIALTRRGGEYGV